MSIDTSTRRRQFQRAFATVFLFAVTFTLSAPWATSQGTEESVPAFNAGPPPKGTTLPAILMKDQLWGNDAKSPVQTHSYELAAKIPALIHQLPCYCYCDRMGHNSLHSCFENTHGAQCTTCMREVYYAYQQNKGGKTATQIRQGIIKGEWKQVDLHTAAEIN